MALPKPTLRSLTRMRARDPVALARPEPLLSTTTTSKRSNFWDSSARKQSARASSAASVGTTTVTNGSAKFNPVTPRADFVQLARTHRDRENADRAAGPSRRSQSRKGAFPADEDAPLRGRRAGRAATAEPFLCAANT